MTNLEETAGGTARMALRPWHIAARVLSHLWGTIALLFLWLAVSRLGWLSAYVLPDPMAVLNRLEEDLISSTFLYAVAQTVMTSVIGLTIGVVAGALTAFVMAEAQFRWLYMLLRPYLTFLNSTPRIVLVPFFILIFGIGEASRIALSASLVFFVMFFGVFGAVQAIRPEYARSAQIMGASQLAAWRRITFPGTLPGMFDSLRISVSLALLGVVVGEIISTPAGLGGLLRVRGDQYDLTGVFSALVVLGALSAGAMVLLKQFELRAFRWR